MAKYKEFKSDKKDVTFCCYSERGIMSYYFFNYLPSEKHIKDFFQSVSKENSQIKNVWENISDVCIFSEFELGNIGFGSPDGAISFKANGETFFIFIEAKFNETYEKSNGKHKIGDKDYNSTLKGQLELRARFVKTLFLNDTLTEEAKIEENPDDYAKKEYFYRDGKSNKENRHLILKEGVHSLVQKIHSCKKENIFYLAITEESENPFKDYENLPNGIETGKLLWMPADFFINP